jgi:hypothetical protein
MAGMYDPARRSDVVAFVFASDQNKQNLAEIMEHNRTATGKDRIGRNAQLQVVRASDDKPITLSSILAERAAKANGESTRQANPPDGSTPSTVAPSTDTHADEMMQEIAHPVNSPTPQSSTATVDPEAFKETLNEKFTAERCMLACEPAFKAAFMAGVTEDEISEACFALIAKWWVKAPEDKDNT